jgi:hypothetical protein
MTKNRKEPEVYYKTKNLMVQALQLTAPQKVVTAKGELEGQSGDWLITGPGGELSFCKDDIFQQTYEPADPDEYPTSFKLGKKPVARTPWARKKGREKA